MNAEGIKISESRVRENRMHGLLMENEFSFPYSTKRIKSH